MTSKSKHQHQAHSFHTYIFVETFGMHIQHILNKLYKEIYFNNFVGLHTPVLVLHLPHPLLHAT